jgi:hypothetical protein
MVRETGSEVAGIICGGLKPRPMPDALEDAFDALGREVPRGPEEGVNIYRGRLTLYQLAVYDAFHKEASDGGTYLQICK